jgi:hypothetical protein
VTAANADGQVLLVCGPTGVGKSTIGFEVYLRTLRSGHTAAYVDLNQLGFIGPARSQDPGGHLLKSRNLAAIWRTYHAAGASHLVATGPLEDTAAADAYVRALPAATVTVCRLTSGLDELTRRILSRGGGGSWPEPGDPLIGQPVAALRQIAGRAVAETGAAAPGIPVDTDGRSIIESAGLIESATNWPELTGIGRMAAAH